MSELFGTLDAELALIPKSGEVLPEDFSEKLSANEHIAHYSAVIESEAIISANGSSEICSVLGVDSNYAKVWPIEGSIVSGVWDKGCTVVGYGLKAC